MAQCRSAASTRLARIKREQRRPIQVTSPPVTFLQVGDVARAGQRTDAALGVKGLLLGPRATINAKPELEIFADDVKCAHGCAIGQLDAAALFYAQQRGLPLEAAQARGQGKAGRAGFELHHRTEKRRDAD